jgi:hypothetical protein
MAAVLSDTHGVFAWGWNHPGPDGFGTHAEEHALSRANRRRLAGSTITIAGLRSGAQRSRSRRFVYSKPCAERCWPLLVLARVKTVEFVTPTGAWMINRLA